MMKAIVECQFVIEAMSEYLFTLYNSRHYQQCQDYNKHIPCTQLRDKVLWMLLCVSTMPDKTPDLLHNEAERR